MADLTYGPASELVGGMEFVPLPEGHMALSAIVLVKGADRDGRIGWYTRYTNDLHTVECLGALRAASLLEEDHVRAAYLPHEDED